MNSMTLRAVSVALTVAGASACGSSTNETADGAVPSPDASGSHDTGRHDTGHAEAGHPDAGHSGHAEAGHPEAASPEAAAEAGPPDCGAVAPTGTQLVASTDPLILQGGRITSDGYAFYLDANTQELYSIAASGGSPAKLGMMTSQSDTFWVNGGKAALFLTAPCNPETLLAPLWVWTAAAGPKEVFAKAFSWDSFNYTYDATQDGSLVAFFSTPGNYTADLAIETVSSGQTMTLVDGIDLTSQSCWPMVQFIGDTIVAYYCLGKNGNGPITISSFAAPSYTQTTLATFPAPTEDAPFEAPAAVSPSGTELLLTPAQGAPNVALYPIAGGAPTTVSPTGAQAGFVANGDIIVLTQDGVLQRYTPPAEAPDAGSKDAGTKDADLKDGHAEVGSKDAEVQDGHADGSKDAGLKDGHAEADTDAGTEDGGIDAGGPLTLVGASAGLEGLLSLSPDGKWVQTFTNYSDTDPYPTNVVIASATTPGPVTTVWSPITATAVGFTLDSKFEVFLAPTGDAGAYELGASAASGGTLITLPAAAGEPLFTTASKFILPANGNALTGSADLEAVDLTNPTAASTLVTQADPYFFYTGAAVDGGASKSSKQLLYGWHCAPTGASGIWTLTPPQ